MTRYGYTEEHEMFRRTVRTFLDKELEPHYRRYADKGGVDKDFWRKAGAAGILGSGVPEEFGGPGADFVFNVILAEELGRSVGSALTGSSLMARRTTPASASRRFWASAFTETSSTASASSSSSPAISGGRFFFNQL